MRPRVLSRSGIEKRLQLLEAVLMDASRLAPHSQKWLEYWDRQFYLFMSGQDPEAIRHSSVDAFRAVMIYAENPASLLGSIPLDE